MTMVNMFQAKTELSKLIKMLEDEKEDCILLCRNNKPIAQIVLCKEKKKVFAPRQDRLPFYGDFDEQNDEIAALFGMA